MAEAKYKFAVVVDTNENWQMWVSEKVYGSHPHRVLSDRFTLRDIEYKRVCWPAEARGYKFDGVIKTETADLNPNFDEINTYLENTLM